MIYSIHMSKVIKENTVITKQRTIFEAIPLSII